MALPNINTYLVDNKKIGLIWKASPKTDIRKWNLYGSSTVPISMVLPAKGVDLSSFTLVEKGIANRDTYLTPGSVYFTVSREDLGIDAEESFYFYITSVDKDGVESVPEISNLHAVPFGDDHYADEAGQPVNLQYKSFEFDLGQTPDWDIDRYLDIVALLGRPGNMLRMEVVGAGDVQISLNAYNSDSFTVIQDANIPFILSRGELLIKKIWFHKSTPGSTLVKIFITG